jgi:hypothetical protein
MSARLNLQEIPYIPWKGKTFSQITSTFRKNVNLPENTPIITSRLFMKPQPLPIYRKEIASIPLNSCNRSTSIKWSELEIPGGTIINSHISDISSNGIVLSLVPELSSNSSEYPGSSCSINKPCLVTTTNALKRVRSAGMIVRKTNNNVTYKYYCTSSNQYLHSRNKTFEQNTFHMLRYGDDSAVPGTAKSVSNAYASNTVSYCSNTNTDSSITTYVPVYYKPSNSRFAEQGAVSSSSRLLRLKYDTITTGGASTNQPFGSATASALSYSTLMGPYSLKTKTGYPLNKIPVISKFNGKLKCCFNKRIIT